MSFRPFSLGDALLLQRLRNYSTPLQIERILLESISPVRTALRSRFPWYRHSSFTYVLRQEENGLAREGLIQLRIRPHSHEADVTLLSPALDAPQGHPAIWQKLLTYSAQHIFRQNVCRLFSDLPDQPLLVNTFRQAGFVPLTQVTIWRLDSAPLASSDSTLRPQRAADAPELEQLYQRITPVPVQRLEMGLAPNQPDEDRISPILSNPHHVHMSGYVLDDDRGRGLAGCVQILWGKTRRLDPPLDRYKRSPHAQCPPPAGLRLAADLRSAPLPPRLHQRARLPDRPQCPLERLRLRTLHRQDAHGAQYPTVAPPLG